MRPIFRTEGHGADCRVRLYADTLNDLFLTAANAVLRSGLRGKRRPPAAQGEITRVQLEAPDVASLLADWMNELIALSEIAGMVHACTEVHVADRAGAAQCSATLRTLPAPWLSPWKAATFHDLWCAKRHGRWQAHVVCDL